MTGLRGSDRVVVLTILGTRPEAIKLFPLILELREHPRFDVFVVNTGQHRDMVRPVLEMADIDADFDLEVGNQAQSLNTLVAGVIAGVSEVIEQLRWEGAEDGEPVPMIACVHGDTSTAMAGALAAVQSRVPVMHVEAGMRTGDPQSPFPEELNRQVIARAACMNFAPTIRSMEHLVREHIPADQIFVTGNTGIDAIQWAATHSDGGEDQRIRDVLGRRAGPLIVATAHRRESWEKGLAGIAAGLRRVLEERPDATLVMPLHPNPIVRQQIAPVLSDLSNALLVEPLGYRQFARLLQCATVVLTDSGGIQEEAPSLGTPVLVTRDETERIEGVDADTLRLVGTNPGTIAEATLAALDPDPERERNLINTNPYGDGLASKRIVAAMETIVFGDAAPTPFGPGFSRDAVLDAAGYGSSGSGPGEPTAGSGRDVLPKYLGPERRSRDRAPAGARGRVRYIGLERRGDRP